MAPIFKHGEGRGLFGCVAGSPPVFPSEEEALVVISEELGRKGVVLSQRGVVWADAPLAPRIAARPFFDDDWKKKRISEEKDEAKPMVVDGVDATRVVAVTYISANDYEAAGGVDPYRYSTVSSFDFVDAAQHLAGKAAQHRVPGKQWLGVFYDPLASPPEDGQDEPPMPAGLDEAAKKAWYEKLWQERTAAGRAAAAAQLRLQVRDFLAWLEAQGAI